MNIFSHSKAQQAPISYPRQIRFGPKDNPYFHFVGAFLFLIVGVLMILAGKDGGWLALISGGVMLFSWSVLTSQRPILVINEKKVKICATPFLPRISIYWHEICAITRYPERGYYYLGFTLSSADRISFLQRHHLLSKKILVRRNERFHCVVRISSSGAPYLSDELLKKIYQQYQTQIREYGIRVSKSYKL